MDKFTKDIDIANAEKKYFAKKKLEILQKRQMEEILESHEDIKQGRVMSEEEFWRRLDKKL
ncbi:hypothetical protein [Breznakia pachnodae]|uniref:Uncharacterized protein n=1 Tax=Breznakia pachnodae TaxID=265178 RepID=A0ABU0E2U6_9FIRM|nr:hypothetical protein [Breznakia pachnodae]MDQ0361069.1 hypothetical protein [Breznakia pachnodae]